MRKPERPRERERARRRERERVREGEGEGEGSGERGEKERGDSPDTRLLSGTQIRSARVLLRVVRAPHERDAQSERARERERGRERIGARYTHVILEDDNEGFNHGLAVVDGVAERAK